MRIYVPKRLKAAVHYVRAKIASDRLIAECNISGYGVARCPQRVSGSARTDSQRAESARNPIASHVNFGDDSALSALTRTQWTAALIRQLLDLILGCEILSKR